MSRRLRWGDLLVWRTPHSWVAVDRADRWDGWLLGAAVVAFVVGSAHPGWARWSHGVVFLIVVVFVVRSWWWLRQVRRRADAVVAAAQREFDRRHRR